MKGIPYLNPDPYCQFIGPKKLSKALIDRELATCLLDNGAQLNFITLPMPSVGNGYYVFREPSPGNRGKNSSKSRHRGYHGGIRRIHHDECSDTLC